MHSFYRLRPETAYLSINYLDRFLSARALPVCCFLLFGLFKKSLKIVYIFFYGWFLMFMCVARERVAYAAFISIMPFTSSKNGGNNSSHSPRLANNQTQILVQAQNSRKNGGFSDEDTQMAVAHHYPFRFPTLFHFMYQ